jgi:hypothetical protein
MESSATQNVEVVEPIRRNIVILGVRMFLVLFLIDTFYAGLLMALVFGYIPSEWSSAYTVMLWVVHTLKDVLLAYLLISMVTNWFSTLYFVAGGHLLRQRGVLQTKESVFQLTDIESVVMSQSWLGKIFDYGNVTISFLVAREREEVTLYAINHPHRYEQVFSKFV